MRHQDAARILNGSDYAAMPGTATMLVRRGEYISLIYHSTPVVTWHPDGTIELDHGRHQTKTIMARINTYAEHIRLISQAGTWLIVRPARPDLPAVPWTTARIYLPANWLIGDPQTDHDRPWPFETRADIHHRPGPAQENERQKTP